MPHFEKMLYDQAQLVLAFLEAGQATGEPFFFDVAEDTLAYVLRDMTDPAAASIRRRMPTAFRRTRGHAPRRDKTEGAFYIWTDAEVERARRRRYRRGATHVRHRRGGNAPHDPQGEFTGKNLLYIARVVDDIAVRTGRTRGGRAGGARTHPRRRCSSARASRPRPHLDDKVLTAWNGLMIAAFARAARVLRVAAGRTVVPRRRTPRRRRSSATPCGARSDSELLRRYRDGDAAIDGYAEDYAFLIFGLLELFQADGDVAWLDWALELQRAQDERFWDEEEGGWFSTTGDDPSGAAAPEGGLRRRRAVGERRLGVEPADPDAPGCRRSSGIGKAEQTLGRLGPRVGAAARAVPMMLCGLSAWHAGLSQIVVVGDARRGSDAGAGARTRLALSAVRDSRAGRSRRRRRRSRRAWSSCGHDRGAGAAAYVCRDFTCQQPVGDPAALAALLDGLSRG